MPLRRFTVALTLAVSACKPAVPPLVAAEQRATSPGQVTVVEFVDFECPFCRRLHASLARVLAAHPGRARIVRKQVPLVAIHPHALAAARASVCADAQGQGDRMADALIAAPPIELAPDAIAQRGSELGLDPAALAACMDSPVTTRRIETDTVSFDAIGGGGVPLLFIGDQRIDGAEDEDVLAAAFERALGALPR